jgi:TolB-like protein
VPAYTQQQTTQQLTAAVIPFDMQEGFTQNDVDTAYTLFNAELAKYAVIKTVDAASVSNAVKEINFETADEWQNSEKVKQLGSKVQANSIIRGQIMGLGVQLIVFATVLDSTTLEILSSARVSLNRIEEFVDKTPQFVLDLLYGLDPQYTGLYRIGEKGPGGGVIFYSGNGMNMECSETIGEYPWDQALTAAQEYRGGDYSDWRLPTKGELELLYTNLRKKNLGALGNDWYWSSSQTNTTHAWIQRFSDGMQSPNYKSSPNCVRAVRTF